LLTSDRLFVDLPDHTTPSDLYTNILPDITLVRDSAAFILELTCCAEVNFNQSRVNKLAKYANPSRSSKEQLTFAVSTVEVSSLGFVHCDGIREFLKRCNLPQLPIKSIRRLGEMALRASFFLFCARHKPWPNNISDPYFL